MNLSIRVILSFTVFGALLVVAACGGTSSPNDSGDDAGPLGPTVTCNGTTSCTGEGACCVASIPDGFGPEGFRCTSGAWRSDTSCAPPPPVCPAPLTGSLSRANGTQVAVTCFHDGGITGVVSASFALGSGELLELYFDRVPRAGDVVSVVPYAERNTFPDARDAGASDGGAGATKAAFRIGRTGGFGGFAESAESKSGKVTVTSVDASGIRLNALRVTLDADTVDTSSGAGWGGKLTGSL